MTDLVCISHLRWDFVWQRPQHLLSRLAGYRRVIFVEEPVTTTEHATPYLQVERVRENIVVIRLALPAREHHWVGHGDPASADLYCRLLADYLELEGCYNPILWLYTPMGLEFTVALNHTLLVYDVMDELSAFRGAPSALRERESILLRQADIVFTGGVSLYQSKRSHNPSTHLFPSGIEIEHYARAASLGAFERPEDMVGLSAPILGYFGVIDERMDLALLSEMAGARPAWQMVMIGPVVKIDPADLPQAPNLHYLGMKPYAQLPAYLAHFDVALIPFAINEHTRYLSPTKTLEYMAAHKPVVSTPVHDVVALYGEVVRIGQCAGDFIAHVEAALVESGEIGLRRVKEDSLLARHTWDSIASRMHHLMEECLTGKAAPRRRSAASA